MKTCVMGVARPYMWIGHVYFDSYPLDIPDVPTFEHLMHFAAESDFSYSEQLVLAGYALLPQEANGNFIFINRETTIKDIHSAYIDILGIAKYHNAMVTGFVLSRNIVFIEA